MPTDLKLDDEINAAKNLGGNATGWATKIEALLTAAFQSARNPFGSSATKDIATETGVGAAGKLPPIGTNGRIDADYINTPQGFIDSSNIRDRSIPAAKIKRGDMTGAEMENLTIGHRKINASGTNSDGDPIAPKYLLGFDSANRKFGWVAQREGIIGEVKLFAYQPSPVPSGWLPCDGRSLSRATYAPLFAALGTVHGNEDNDHFNLPDMRGRVGVSKGTTDLTAKIGSKSGAESIALTIAQMPAHGHNSVWKGSSSLLFNDRLRPYIASSNTTAGDSSYDIKGSNFAPQHGKTTEIGNSDPISIMQPYIVMFAMIYAGQ